MNCLVRRLFFVTFFILSTSAWTAPIPTLIGEADYARFIASQENGFSNIWDVYVSATPQNQTVLDGWFNSELSEVLAIPNGERVVLKTFTNYVQVVKGEHLKVVIKSHTWLPSMKGELNGFALGQKLHLNKVPHVVGNYPLEEEKTLETAQIYVEDSNTYIEAGLRARVSIFDWLITNNDRSASNLLLTEEGNVVYIDNEQGIFRGKPLNEKEPTIEDYFEIFPTKESWEKFDSITSEQWDTFLDERDTTLDGKLQFKKQVEHIKIKMKEYFGVKEDDSFFVQAKIQNELDINRRIKAYSAKSKSYQYKTQAYSASACH